MDDYREDPEWIAAHEKYVARLELHPKDDNWKNTQYLLINKMHDIEVKYENSDRVRYVAALDHFIVLAGWAIGEGYGSSETEAIAETEEHRKVLERALRIHSTIELMS